MDTVVRYYLKIVLDESEVLGGFNYAVQRVYTILYADDGMLGLTQPEWLQWYFGVLTGIF